MKVVQKNVASISILIHTFLETYGNRDASEPEYWNSADAQFLQNIYDFCEKNPLHLLRITPRVVSSLHGGFKSNIPKELTIFGIVHGRVEMPFVCSFLNKMTSKENLMQILYNPEWYNEVYSNFLKELQKLK